MKKLFTILLIGCLFCSSVLLAEKPTEHEFKSGVMAEIFEQLSGAGGQSIITSEDLVGTWTTHALASAKKANDAVVDEAWSLDPEDLYLQYTEGTIIFNDDGDGSFSITCPMQDPFYLITTDMSETPTYRVVGDSLYRWCFYTINGQKRWSLAVFSIKRITQNIIIFKLLDGSNYASKVVICERVLQPQ